MSTRNVSRRGGWRIKPFTAEQKCLCMQLHEQGESTRRIASILNLKFKRIDEYIRMVKTGRNTIFTPEEVAKLIRLYLSGFTKVKVLHQYFTDKEGWSIRNKILYLHRRGLLMNMVRDEIPTTEIGQSAPTISACSLLDNIKIHSTTIEGQQAHSTVNLSNDHQNNSTTADSEQIELTANVCNESDMQQTASTATEAQPVMSMMYVGPDQGDNDDTYETYHSDNNDTIFGDFDSYEYF